jgi:osmotically inducible protein OsmC
MATRTANARWEGTLKEGTGHLKVGSGAYEGAYNFISRFEGSAATNPEELLGAAHAGCYSMALNAALERNGFPAKYVHTTAQVHLTKGESGFSISKIELVTEAEVPNIENDKFQQFAADTLKGCIISRALAAVEMSVEATLK